MYFKKIRSIKLPEEVQGYIRFYCLNYYRLCLDKRQIIDKLCLELAGIDYKALREALISKHKSIISISIKYNVSDKKLYSLRRKFYYAFAQRYLYNKPLS